MPFGSWPNELDATNFGPACAQFERTTGRVVGQEDCLFLNVFTPHSRIPKGTVYSLEPVTKEKHVSQCIETKSSHLFSLAVG